MEALKELISIVDEIKELISSDDYLKIMDLSKKVHHHVLREAQLTRISARFNCFEHGAFCECDAESRVNEVLDEIDMLPMYLKTIACFSAEQFGLARLQT